MSDAFAETYDLGLIDEYGKLRILIGKHLLTFNCIRLFERYRSPDYSCQFPCSCFSGPTEKMESFYSGGETKYGYAVRLLCSGRTLYFKKFINLLKMQKPDNEIKIADLSDEEIIKELGLLNPEVVEDEGDE